MHTNNESNLFHHQILATIHIDLLKDISVRAGAKLFKGEAENLTGSKAYFMEVSSTMQRLQE